MSFFFQIFHEKLPVVMHMIGQKNINSVKPTPYYGPKKSIECPFFPISHEKITALMSIFCQKRPFCKNKQLSCPYFVRKTSTLLKTKCSHVIFFIFFHEKPILLCPYLVKKRIFCQNYTILWAIKVNTQVFFFNRFCIQILYVFQVVLKKYSFGGYPFLKILEKYSFLLYLFFPNFGIFFKKYSFMVSSFVANFRKSIRFGSFLPFFLKVLV